MLVVGLALLSGVCFGAVNVAIRWGLQRAPDAEVGGALAAVVSVPVALAIGAAIGFGRVDLGDAWPFVLVGVFVPGVSQILYVRAIRDAGASRSAVVMGTSPLLSALIALVALDEPFHVALAIGTVLIVSGGVLLAWEPGRPEHVRTVGLVLALSVAAALAVRDNVVRKLVPHSDLEPPARALALLLGATLLLLAYVALTRRRDALAALQRGLPAFVPGGIAMGCTYLALLEALSRGRVTVVAPLNGMNAIWTVALSALVLRRVEAVNARLVIAAVATVAGGALIGAFR